MRQPRFGSGGRIRTCAWKAAKRCSLRTYESRVPQVHHLVHHADAKGAESGRQEGAGGGWPMIAATPTAQPSPEAEKQEKGPDVSTVGQPPPMPAGPRLKLRVLRQRCIDCVGGPRLATRCEMRDCPLWDYRTGHRPKGYKAKRTPLKALRAYCLWCCQGSRHEVRLCPVTDCPLWPWRRGQSRTGDPAPPSAPRRAPESRTAPRSGESETSWGRNDLRVPP